VPLHIVGSDEVAGAVNLPAPLGLKDAALARCAKSSHWTMSRQVAPSYTATSSLHKRPCEPSNET
jgi:hypothetical protein